MVWFYYHCCCLFIICILWDTENELRFISVCFTAKCFALPSCQKFTEAKLICYPSLNSKTWMLFCKPATLNPTCACEAVPELGASCGLTGLSPGANWPPNALLLTSCLLIFSLQDWAYLISYLWRLNLLHYCQDFLCSASSDVSAPPLITASGKHLLLKESIANELKRLMKTSGNLFFLKRFEAQYHPKAHYSQILKIRFSLERLGFRWSKLL